MNSEPKTGNPTNRAMNRKIEATFERLVKDRNCRAVGLASKSFKPLLIKIGPSGSNGLSAEVAHGAGFDFNITVFVLGTVVGSGSGMHSTPASPSCTSRPVNYDFTLFTALRDIKFPFHFYSFLSSRF